MEVESAIGAARREWPVALLPEAALGLFFEAAALLPRTASGIFAECHLSEPDRADLIVRLHPDDRDGLLRDPTLPPRWRPVLEVWQRPGGPLTGAPAVDLEVDLPGRCTEGFECVLSDPDFVRGIRAIAARDALRRRAGKAALAAREGPEWLRALYGHDVVSDALIERMLFCHRALPPSGAFVPNSVRAGRVSAGESGLRVMVTVLFHELVPYMKAIEWPGDLGALADTLRQFAPGEVYTSVDLTLGPGGPHRRAALSWERRRATPLDPSVPALLRALEKARFPLHPRRWRGLQEWLEARRNGPARSLSIKLVLQGDAAPTVKAYVAAFDPQAPLLCLGDRPAGRGEATHPPPAVPS